MASSNSQTDNNFTSKTSLEEDHTNPTKSIIEEGGGIGKEANPLAA
jgi:hypothetical protein